MCLMATFAAVALNPNEPVSMATLLSLVQLTEFVMLMPRFMASVPSSWVEYQQDQHRLYQHTLVDPLLHTRTWKLRTENSRQVMSGEHNLIRGAIWCPLLCHHLLGYCTICQHFPINLVKQQQ